MSGEEAGASSLHTKESTAHLSDRSVSQPVGRSVGFNQSVGRAFSHALCLAELADPEVVAELHERGMYCLVGGVNCRRFKLIVRSKDWKRFAVTNFESDCEIFPI